MLVIKDKWGEIVFESENYDEIVAFGKNYKQDNSLLALKVTTKLGMFHSYL